MRKGFYALGLSSLILLFSCGGGGGISDFTDSNISGISDGTGSSTSDSTGSSTQVITQKGYAVDDVLNGTVKVYYFPNYNYILPYANPIATGEVVNGEFQIQIPQKQGVWVACVEGTDGINVFTQDNPLCGVFDFTGNAWFVNPLTDFIYSFYISGEFFPLSDLKNFLSQKLNTVYKDSAVDLNDAVQYVDNLKQNLGIVNSREWEWKLAIFKKTEISSKIFNSQVEIIPAGLTGENNIPDRVENTISYICGSSLCYDPTAYLSPDGEFAISSSISYTDIYVKSDSGYYIRIAEKEIDRALENYYELPCELRDGTQSSLSEPYSVFIDITKSYLTNCDFSSLKTDGYVECQYVAKINVGLYSYLPGEQPPVCDTQFSELDATTLNTSYLIGTVRIKLTEKLDDYYYY